uniref:THAP domain-containing protein 5 n=1 Tax=Labrus bergylta TaxID=56723 RepID=A0A3Q3EF47_9LABR
MPRYCAVKLCRNRGGAASKQEDKRISFYPFPLQDKPRLQKWVHNMKREEWTPSRHQYLCSEHFTEDCFDIRWGIRYLKNTAIPTTFPSTEDVSIRLNVLRWVYFEVLCGNVSLIFVLLQRLYVGESSSALLIVLNPDNSMNMNQQQDLSPTSLPLGPELVIIVFWLNERPNLI